VKRETYFGIGVFGLTGNGFSAILWAERRKQALRNSFVLTPVYGVQGQAGIAGLDIVWSESVKLQNLLCK